jgi:hypothetical protein
MGEEKAPGRIQLVSVGMSTVGTAPGGDVFHSVPFTGVVLLPYGTHPHNKSKSGTAMSHHDVFDHDAILSSILCTR